MFLFNLCLCQKSIKSSLETGRTFATLLADIETRQLLIEAETEEQFKVCSELSKNKMFFLPAELAKVARNKVLTHWMGGWA